MNLLKELTEEFASKGYEGKYLQKAVFDAAIIIATFQGNIKAAEYFLLRSKQTQREIEWK